jgi:LPS sulfotransferase NodH
MAEPQFSFRAINYLVRLLTAHDASWDAYFLGLGHEPLKITYEDLAGDPEPIIREILTQFGIPAPANLEISAPRLKIQSDELSERWFTWVQEHLSALESPDSIPLVRTER